MNKAIRYLFSLSIISLLGSCQAKWTEDNKKDFMTKCIDEGGAAKQYCGCVYERLSAEYKNPNEAMKSMRDSSYIELAYPCLPDSIKSKVKK